MTCDKADSFSQSVNIKPMQKQRVVFFPARFQQPLPKEMYGNFISTLNDNYELHIASKNKQDNDELLQKLQDSGSEYDNIAFISHSSGVADLWDTYYSNPDINIEKVVLIEPLDLKKGVISVPSPNDLLPFDVNSIFDKFNLDLTMDLSQIGDLNDRIEEIVETDYVELFKSNMFGGLFSDKKTKPDEIQDNDDVEVVVDQGINDDEPCSQRQVKSKLLVIKHKISDKWRFIPTVPPLSRLNFDLIDFEKSMDKSEVMVDKFSHFDILDRPWANLMNRASFGKNKNQEELNEYLHTIGNIVCNFYDTI